MRPMCPACNQRPRAINCYRGGKIYYRSRCETCIKKNKKIKPPTPRWQISGYKKKPTCDRCGFKARHTSQLLVYHVDGNLNNSELRNLKTVCLNCVADLKRSDSTWRQGDLEVDS
jgi:hypothetical protein